MIKKLFLLLFLVAPLWGCENWERALEDFDVVSFVLFGDSILDVEMPSNLKELHLDDERMDGEKVILSGSLMIRDKFKTYGVLEDDSGRVLTVFTELKHGWEILNQEKASQVRVLGRVETGQGGVRILKVIALKSLVGSAL